MTTRQLTRLALLAALALILFVLEVAIPRPLPWMKIGLGNTAVLIALVMFDWRSAAAVMLIKVLVGSLVTGAFGGPSFVLAAGSSVASLVLMATSLSLGERWLSILGLSVVGACVHQVSQLCIASVYLGHDGLWGLLPLFIVSGVIAGSMTGLVAYFACRQLQGAQA